MAYYVRSLKKRGVDPMNEMLAVPSDSPDEPALAV